MEEEDTREVLLPNWQGSGSMGITLDQNDEGVFVKQLAQNSPAAKTGVMKEGDQIVGATVYFDNMSSEDIQRLLANVGQHTVGLKLQRKGDRSPQPGMSWSHDVFSLKSPDVVLSGDDEDYRRIYTKKIKPRLKSDDSLESETQTRTITVTKKVTAYTVDVSGSKDSKEIDINSPEYKIKVPRCEVTEISKTSMDTGGGKTVIRIPGAGIGEEQHFLTTRTDVVARPGDSVSVHTTNVHHYEHSGGVSDFPDIHTDPSIQMTSRSSGLAEFPDINISAPKFQSYDRKVDMKSSRFEIDPEVSLRGPNVAGAASLDISKKNTAIATDLDQTTKSTLDFHRQQPSLESPTGGFQSSVSMKGSQFDIKPSGSKVDSSATGINLKGADINLSTQKTQVGIALPAMSEYGSGKGAMDSQADLTVPTQNIVKGLQTDSDGFSGKVQIPALKIPKFGLSETQNAAVESAVNLQTSVSASTSVLTRDSHLPKSKLAGKIDAPSANIRAPTFAVSSHTLETSAVDVRNAKGNLDTHSPMLELKGPEGNVKSPSVKMPSVKVELKNVNDVDLKSSDGKVTIPKFKMPKFGMSDVEAEGSIINNIPKGDVAISVPKTDVNMPSMQDAKFSMQPMHLPKVPLPDVDVSVKGTKMEEGLKGPRVPTRGSGVKLDAPDIDGKIRMPAVILGAPSVDISGKLKDQTMTLHPIDYDKKDSNLKEDLSVEMKGPGLALGIPDVKLKQAEGNFQVPKFKMPKFNVSEKPFDLEGKMKGPKIDVMGPEVNLDTPNVNIESQGILKMPEFSIPKLGVSGSKIECPDVGITLPKGDHAVSGPRVDVDVRNIDLECPEGTIKGSKFKMPSMDFTKPKLPNIDLNLKGPKVGGDFKGPQVDIPVAEINVDAPHGDLEGKQKFNMSKFGMPKFGSGPKIECPDVDITLPKGDVPNIDLEGTSKGSKLKMPSVDFNVPKVLMPNIDLNLKAPKVGDLKGPELEVDLPDLDVDGPEGKFKMPKLKVPKSVSSGPKLQCPDADVSGANVELKNAAVESAVNLQTSVSASTSVLTHDIHLPKSKLAGKIDAPSANIRAPTFAVSSHTLETSAVDVMNAKGNLDTHSPMLELKGPEGNVKSPSVKMPSVKVELKNVNDVDLKSSDGKVTIPKFKMPKFGMSDVEAEGSIINNIPKGDVAISVPKTDFNMPSMQDAKLSMQPMHLPKVPLPDVDVSVKGTKMEEGLKGPRVPTRGSGVKLDAPDIDGKIRTPAVSLGAPSVDISGKLKDQTMTLHPIGYDKKDSNLKEDLSVEMKGPGLALDIPDVKLKQAEGNFQVPKFKMPKFNVSEKPFDLEGKMKGPKIDVMGPGVNLDTPNVNIESQGNLKMPEFSIPKLGVSGSKIECPDVGITLPKGDHAVSGPRVGVDVRNIDLECPEGTSKSSKFKMPSMDFTKPKLPNIDLNLKGPKVGGDFKGPQVDIPVAEMDVDAPHGDLEGKRRIKMPKFVMPKFGSGPKIECPDVDITLPKGDYDVSGPRVEVDVPNINLEGTSKGSKFKMPSMDFSFPKVPNIDLNLKGPKVGGDFKGPQVDIPVAEINVDAPHGDLEGNQKTKMPKFVMPKFGSGPKIECPDVDITLPKGDYDVSGPRVEVDVPNINLEGTSKGSKFKMPSMDFTKPKLPNIDLNLKGPKVGGDFKGPQVDIPVAEMDVDAPHGDLEGKRRIKMPKFVMPKFGSGPKIECPDVDITLPKGDYDVSGPRVEGDVTNIDLEGTSKGSKFKMPSMDFSFPKVPNIDLNLKGPKVGGDFKGPQVDIPVAEMDVDAPHGDLEGNQKTKMPKFVMPKFGSGPKIECPDVDITLPKGDYDVSGPRVEVDVPNINLEGTSKGSKFKMPSMDFTKPKLPNIDLNLKGPKVGGDFKGPQVDIPVAEMDVDAPHGDLEGNWKLKMPKFNMPKLAGSGPKIECPDVDITLPKGDHDVSGPRVELDVPDIDLEGTSKGSKFKMPSMDFTKPKLPNIDLNLKGPKVGGDFKGPQVDIPVAEMDVDAPHGDLEGKRMFKMPKFVMPKFGSGPKIECPDVDITLPKGDYDVSGPRVEVDVPNINLEGTSKGSKFKMPSMDFTKPKLPNIDLNLKGPKVGGDFKGPQVDIPVAEMDVDAPHGDLEGNWKLKMPKFNMPKLAGSGPKIECPDVDITLPKGDHDVSGPRVELDVPDIDLEGTSKGSKFKMPSMDFTKPKLPNIDLNLKGPKVGGDFKGPQVDIPVAEMDVDAPHGDLEGNWKLKMPKFNMPKLAGSGPKIECPDVDITLPKGDHDVSGPRVEVDVPNINLEGTSKGSKFKMPSMDFTKPKLPNIDLNLKGPKVGGDFKGPQVDIPVAEMDVDAPHGDLEGNWKLKMPKFNMPKLAGSGPKIECPDVDITLPKGDHDVSGPRVELDVPDIDLEGTSKGSKFKMPSMDFSFPKVPNIDLNLKGPKVGGDFKGPQVDIPVAEMDVDAPHGDLEGKRMFKMPKFVMPKFGSGPKIECPDVDITLPKGDYDVSGPRVEGDVTNIDLEGTSKGSKFKMPSMDFSFPKVPNIDLNLKGPKVGGDVKGPQVDIPVAEMDVDAPHGDLEGKGKVKMPKHGMPKFGSSPKIECPDVDITLPKSDHDVSGPRVELNVPNIDLEGTGKGSKLKMPSVDFNVPKVLMPNIDLNLKAPKVGDLKGPELELDFPDLDVDSPEGKLKMPKLKVPKFVSSDPKLQCPDANVELKTPELDLEGPEGKGKASKFKLPAPKLKGDLNIPGANLEGDLKAPEVEVKCPDIDLPSSGLSVDLPEGKIKGPRFKLPSWGFTKPSISMPDTDLHMKRPKVKGEIDATLSKGGSLKSPGLDISAPKIGVDIPGAKVKKSRFKMPKFNFSGPKVQTASADVKFPSADIDVSGPDVNISNLEAKGKSPKFKMPSLNITSPKVSMPDVELNLKGPKVKGDMDVTVPNIEGQFKGPKLDLNAPELHVEPPEVDLECPDVKGKVKIPKLSMPKFAISVPKMEAADIDVKLPKGKFDISGPTLDEVPDTDIEGPDGKIKAPKMKVPSLNVKLLNMSMPDVDFDLKGPKLGGAFKGPNIKGPEVDLETPNVELEGKLKGSKVKMQAMNLPTVSMPDLDLKGPKMEGGLKGPKVDDTGPEMDFVAPNVDLEGNWKLKMPKFNMPKLAGSGPKIECPDVDITLPKGDHDVSGPRVELDVPDIDLEGTSKGSKFKMPSMDFSFPKVPNIDLNLKGPKVGGNFKGPQVDIPVAEMDVDAPHGDLEGKRMFKMPKFVMPKFGSGPKIECPDVDITLPKGDHDVSGPRVELDVPDIDLEGTSKGSKFKMPSMDFSFPKVPNIDLNLKGPKVGGDFKGPQVDIPVAEMDVDAPHGDLEGKRMFKIPKLGMPKFGSGPKIECPDVDITLPKGDHDVSGPRVELDVPDIDLEGTSKGSKFKMPSMDFSFPKVPNIDLNLKGPKVGGDFKGPQVDIPVAEMDVDAPHGDLEGKRMFKMPKFVMPKFGSGPKIECPDVDITLPKGDHDVSGPRVELDVPDIDLEGTSKGSKFKMPSMDFSFPKVPNIDLNLKGPKVGGDFKGPQVDIPVAEMDVDAPHGDLEGKRMFKIPKLGMPKFGSGPKIECPDVDITLPKGDHDVSGPRVELDVPDVDLEGTSKGSKFKMPSMDFSFPKVPNIDLNLKGPKGGDFKGPQVDIPVAEMDVDAPHGDLEGKRMFKIPKLGMPKFGSGPKIECPDVDITLPKGDHDVSGPRVELDVPDIDLEGTSKGSKFKMPSMDFSFPKVPNIDLNLKGPKVGGDLKGPSVDIKGRKADLDVADVHLDGKGPKFNMPSMPNIDFNLKGPKVDMKVAQVDLDAPDIDGKMKGPDFKMPSLHFPKVPMPTIDLHLKSPKREGDLKGPNVEFKAPEVNYEASDVDIEGKGNVKMPKFCMPKFAISGPKVGSPDVDVHLPEGELDVSGPKLDVQGPNIDLEGPEGKIKGPKCSVPSMNANIPNISMPKIDWNLKSPKVEGNLKGPKVEASDIDIDGKVKGPSIKMPSMKLPDFDLNLKGPNWKGDASALKMGGDVGGTKVDIMKPGVDIECPEGKMPKFKLPKFKPNLEGPDISIKPSKGDIELAGPKVDLEAPDLDVKGPKGKIKGSELKMPSLNFDLPKVPVRDIDLNLKGPNWSGGTDVSVPNLKGGLSGPNAAIEMPYVEGPDSKFKMPKFKMPKFGVSVPRVDTDMDVVLEKSELDVSGPKIDLESPEMEGKLKGPKCKIPSTNVNLPSINMSDFDINVKGPKMKGDVELSGPKVGATDLAGNVHLKNPNVDFKTPDVNIEAPDVTLKGPAMDIEGPEGNLKMPKMKKSKFGFGMKSPKAEVKTPSLDVRTPDMEFDADVPELDLESKGKKIRFKMPKIHMSGPKIKGKKGGFDVSTPDAESDINLNAADADINLSGGGADLGIKAPKSRKPLFGKMYFPDVEFDLKSPKLKSDAGIHSPKADIKTPGIDFEADLKTPEGDLKTPEGELSLRGVDIDGSDIKVKKPKFKLPGFNLSGPKVSEADLHLSGPKVTGDLNAPSMDVNLGASDINLKATSVSVDPSLSVDPDIDGSDIKVKKPKFKLPAFNLSGPKVSEADLHLSGPKVTGDLNAPSMDVNLGASDINLKATSVSVDPSLSGISVPDVNVDMKGPTVRGDLDVSGNLGTDISGASGKVKIPKYSIPKFGLSSHSAHGSYEVSTPDFEGNLKGPSIDMSLPKVSNSDFEMHLSGPKIKSDMDISNEFNGGKFDIGLPSARMKGLDANVTMPNVDISGPSLHGPDNSLLGNVSVSGPKLEFPDASSKIEIPYVNVTGKDSEVQVPKAHLKGNVEGFKIGVEKSDRDLQGVSLGGVLSENVIGGVQFKGREGLQISGPKADAGQARAGMNFNTREGYFGEPVGVVTFPRLLMPKFTSSGPELTGREVGVDVDFPKSNVSLGKAGLDDVELEESDIKIKKSKIKMPKFNFSKAKGKSDASLSEVSVTESKGDLKRSKASLGSVEGAVGSAGLEVGSGVGIPSKEKSGKYEFSLFTSSKSRHRSSSLSEEMDSSTQSSPSGTLEAQAGEVALEGSKKKGKHSKIKFGTFGGIGSKSKGSYEVTLSDDENVQGSGASLSSRKSRVSSSSSNDSATKAGLQMPKVELTVAKKKQ